MRFRIRAAVLPVLLAAILIPTAAAVPVAASTPTAAGAAYSTIQTTEAARVVANAKTKLGKPWVFGATGPYAYDCSGFVFDVFRDTGLLSRIGGIRRTARGYYDYFRYRGLASRTGGRVGDLVVWGYGKHIGIYLGSGMAISALTSGVRIWSIYHLTSSFTAFLHVRLTR